MIKRASVVLCLVLAMAVGYLLPHGSGVDTAEAGRRPLRLCLGESIVIHNPTDEPLDFTATVWHADGSGGIPGIPFTVDPHKTVTSSAGITGRAWKVEASKKLRVLGSSGTNTGSNGYSECVKTK
jgi:hypothetical protein